jgi:hypothetical protein
VRTASQLVDEIASDVLPPQGVAIVLTERSGSRCPFWLAALRVSDFAQTAAVQAGIVLPRGSLGSRLGFVGDAPRARIPLHSSRIRLFLSHSTLSSQATSEIAKPIVTTSRQSAVNRPMRETWRSIMGSSLAVMGTALRAGAVHCNSWLGPLRRSP